MAIDGSAFSCAVKAGKPITSGWLRLMREDNLLCLRQTPFVPTTTNSRHSWHVVPNPTHGIVLNDLNQFWVADITYLHLAEEFGYLAVILDAFSRKVVSWALDSHLRAEL